MIVEMHDQRLLARIINVAHRYGCAYERLESTNNGGTWTATIDLSGPAESLRRLNLHIAKLLHDDKETFA